MYREYKRLTDAANKEQEKAIKMFQHVNFKEKLNRTFYEMPESRKPMKRERTIKFKMLNIAGIKKMHLTFRIFLGATLV